MSLVGIQPDLVNISIQIEPPMVTWPGRHYSIHNFMHTSITQCINNIIDSRWILIQVYSGMYYKLQSSVRDPWATLVGLTWLRYCRYGIKLYPINQSIMGHIAHQRVNSFAQNYDYTKKIIISFLKLNGLSFVKKFKSL